MRRPAALALGALLWAAIPLAAQDAAVAPRFAAAQRFLRANGSAEVMTTMMKNAIPVQRTQNPQIPAEFWERFEERINRDTPQLLDSLAALYARTFSLEEINAFIAFYQTPAGQRLREMQVQIATESSQIGQRWGARIGAEIGASLAPK